MSVLCLAIRLDALPNELSPPPYMCLALSEALDIVIFSILLSLARLDSGRMVVVLTVPTMMGIAFSCSNLHGMTDFIVPESECSSWSGG